MWGLSATVEGVILGASSLTARHAAGVSA